MKFKIFNPKEDIQGNSKENIFVVMDESGYLGSGYVYPKLTSITPDHPVNIFIDINIDDKYLYHEIGFELFHLLRKQAISLFKHTKLNKGLLYYGSEVINEKIHFFRDQGFKEDIPTYKMKSITNLDKGMCSYEVTTDESYNEEMIALHNKYLLKPIDHDVIHSLKHKDDYCCYQIFDKRLIASMIIYKDHVGGWIDHIVVDSEYKHKGIGRFLLGEASNYFKKRLINEMNLEVWSANSSALKFYKKLGFEEESVTEHYVGLILEK